MSSLREVILRKMLQESQKVDGRVVERCVCGII